MHSRCQIPRFVPHSQLRLCHVSGQYCCGSRKGGKVAGDYAYLSDFYPAFHHLGSLLWLQQLVPEARGNYTVGDTVELRDSGPDCGSQMFFALLVPLGPYAAQAVIRHNFLKQLLEHGGMVIGIRE